MSCPALNGACKPIPHLRLHFFEVPAIAVFHALGERKGQAVHVDEHNLAVGAARLPMKQLAHRFDFELV